MFRILIFATLVLDVLGASITPSSEPQTSSESYLLLNVSTESSLKNAVYTPPTVEIPRLPLLPFNYPTYPEYVSNYSEEALDNHKNELVPSFPPRNAGGWTSSVSSYLMPIGNRALTYVSRAVVFIFQFAAVAVIGLILTTSVCTFTPFCAISFAGFDMSKSQIKKQVTELARAYITPENLDAVTDFTMKAIEKYAQKKILNDE